MFFFGRPEHVPTTLLHNLKHNKVLHERVLFFTVTTADVPRLPNLERTECGVIVHKRVYQATVRYGFMEDPDVMRALALLSRHGLRFERDETTFFLGKSTHRPRRAAGPLHLAQGAVPLDAAEQPEPASSTSTSRPTG